MKHVTLVSQQKCRPAAANSLLVKQEQVTLLGSLVAVLADISVLVKSITGGQEEDE